MFRFVKSRPGEFLVVGQRGKLRNLGVGAGTWLRPGSSFVRLPTGKEEARFSMVQESADGIPLQFKGSAVYRVVDPVAAAQALDLEQQTAQARLREEGVEQTASLERMRADAEASAREEALERQALLTRRSQETDATLRREHLEQERESAELALEVEKRQLLVKQIEVEKEMLRAREEAELEQTLLPQRQLPEIANALTSLYDGANVSIYGGEDVLTKKVMPLFDMLLGRVQQIGAKDVG